MMMMMITEIQLGDDHRVDRDRDIDAADGDDDDDDYDDDDDEDDDDTAWRRSSGG